MANLFIHFEPIGPVGEEIVIAPDLPQYVVRGKCSFSVVLKFPLINFLANLVDGE